MKKVVIRNKNVTSVFSNMILEKIEGTDLEQIVYEKGKEYVLEKIFEEKEVSVKELEEEYTRFEKGENSKFFSWMYILNNNYGLVIDEHITLYSFEGSLLNEMQKIYGWAYVEKKKYLADAWWFEDGEILADIQNLSILDFFEKYRFV